MSGCSPHAFVKENMHVAYRTHSHSHSEVASQRCLSAGSLLVVMLLRTAQYNMSKLKDVYMHQNTLAALANVAPHMAGMSSHAAQRLVSLFDMLARRSVLSCSYRDRLSP